MVKTKHLLAPAKINLTLRVIGRLPNGYHELDSWMHKVQLADELTLRQTDKTGIHLLCPGSDLPTDESNLVYQAALKFYEYIDVSPSLEIILKKKIPIAAGLGGGSSDCAAVLMGLSDWFDHPITDDALHEIGTKLGADVPFFLNKDNSARAQGIGERLSPLPSLPPCYIVLVNPAIAVSTGWVFNQLRSIIPLLDGYLTDSQKTAKNSNYALTRDSKTYNLGRASAEGNLPNLFNDLEEITAKKHPEITSIKSILSDCGAEKVLMSGSGSTVFGLFTDKNRAILCKDEIQSDHPDWYLFLTEPLLP
jgi:4-diphosphocytidyl-2-C-methyl-D-erythritol kinase